jgi:pyridoxamine 5'-phosphate oxidase
LATASRTRTPSARIVLFKGVNESGIKFFTNYSSRKGKELKSNPQAALVFYWSALDRQIRIEGKIQTLSPEESDAYWVSRPRESQVGAIASSQSSVIPNRQFLENKLKQIELKYAGKEIPRPKNWGGFCLLPKRVEFWISGEHRIHDRFCFLKKGKKWSVSRLSP